MLKNNCTAYFYHTNLRFYVIVVNWYSGLFHDPFLDGICDVWHHWKREKNTKSFLANRFSSAWHPFSTLKLQMFTLHSLAQVVSPPLFVDD